MTTASETTSPVIVTSTRAAVEPAPIPIPPTKTTFFSSPRLARLRANPLLRIGSPWFVSFLFHGVLLIVVGFLLWKLGGAPPVPPPPPVVSFADPSLGHVGRKPDAGTVQSLASRGEAASSESASDSEKNIDAGVTSMVLSDAGLLAAFKARPARDVPATSPSASESAGLALGIGVGPRSTTGTPATGSSVNAVTDSATSNPAGTNVTFAGLGSSGARSVVYVVDASGSMVSSLRDVVGEIERSVARLSPSQKFGVVVFHDPGRGTSEGTAQATSEQTESFMPILVRATPDARARLATWLSGIDPKGKSNPLDGLRAGLELKSEAVFLLSRSIERTGGGVWQLGLDATMRELDRLNPLDPTGTYRSVAIKTIQFLDEDSSGIMQAIGLKHGGTGGDAGYKVVRRGKDLE